MPTIEYITRPQGPILANYMNSWNRIEDIMGPLGSGKTIQSCQKLMYAIQHQEPNPLGIRPSRFVAVRNTYSDLLTTTVKDWLELYGDLGKYSEGSKKPPIHVMDFDLEDGTTVNSELVFLAMDRPDSIKKLRGMQATGFWLNEKKELSKAVCDMADMRHGRYPSMATGLVKCSPWHGMIGDYNAPDDDHYLYETYEEIKPKNHKLHKQPGGLFKQGHGFVPNPNAENLKNLPPDYYVQGMEGKNYDWILVNLANEYGVVMSGKPVYPEYTDSVHCMDVHYVPDPNLPIILGADFGRTPAAAFIQFLPSMGRYIGFDEFCTDDMSATSFAPELKGYIDRTYPNFKFARGGGDPSGDGKGQATDDKVFPILHKHGLPIFPTVDRSNNVLLRRSSIINPMKRLCMDGKPAFMISPKCKMWRKGLAGGFNYKRVQVIGDERYKDEPDKNKYSHICEAGEYGLMQAGEGAAAVKREHSTFNQSTTISNDFNIFT